MELYVTSDGNYLKFRYDDAPKNAYKPLGMSYIMLYTEYAPICSGHICGHLQGVALQRID
jgi:hypothetical protein